MTSTPRACGSSDDANLYVQPKSLRPSDVCPLTFESDLTSRTPAMRATASAGTASQNDGPAVLLELGAGPAELPDAPELLVVVLLHATSRAAVATATSNELRRTVMKLGAPVAGGFHLLPNSISADSQVRASRWGSEPSEQRGRARQRVGGR